MPNNTIWSGGGGLVGWVNTKVLDETHDAGKAQGWTALIVDTNGNGKRDAYVEPNEPVDPAKDKTDRRQLLRRDGEPARRLGLGLGARVPGRGRARGSRIESAGDGDGGNLEVPGMTEASAGFSPRGMDVDRERRRVDGARQRPARRASIAASARGR